MPADPVRDAAVDVLLRIFNKGAFIDRAIDRSIRRRNISRRGSRFLTQIVYGVVRNRTLIDETLRPVLRQPLKDLPDPIQMVLRIGVCQALFCDNVPFPVMVHTSVDLAKKRGHVGTAKLVNAVLKRVPKSIEEIALPDMDSDRRAYLSVRYSMPRWIVDRWSEDFGDELAETLCESSAQQAPTTIRTNTAQTGVPGLKKRLEQADCVVEKQTEVPEELTILDGPPPAKLKLFQRGAFTVQDPASMLPPHLLELEEGDRVLDLCAAPGGKATHAAQIVGREGFVIAMDAHFGRAQMIQENADRLDLTDRIGVVTADGCAPPYSGTFGKIMVDAPCSGLGTLRRHPDLKWRIQEADLANFADRQAALLRAATALCDNQGLIVYSVCTMTAEETDTVIAEVLDSEPLQLEDGPDWLHPWKIATGVYRTLPNLHGLDGFFLTRLRKSS